MSHEATNWAVKQRGLQPVTKIILWHLANRHNPDFGCFPNQANLAHDCEISRSTLNRHLLKLEAAGLIRREQRLDDQTKEQLSTKYHLSMDTKSRVSNCDTDQEPVCQNEPIPCVKNGQSRVSNWDTNTVRETVRETVSNNISKKDSFEEFWSAFNYHRGKKECEGIWKGENLDEISDEIISRAKQYASSRFGEEKFWKWPKTWLMNEGWKDEIAGQRSSKPITPETLAAIEAGRKKAAPEISLSDNHFMNRFNRGEFDG